MENYANENCKGEVDGEGEVEHHFFGVVHSAVLSAVDEPFADEIAEDTACAAVADCDCDGGEEGSWGFFGERGVMAAGWGGSRCLLGFFRWW